MTPPPETPEDDPKSSKLPPTNRETETGEAPRGWLPTDGVSSKLKIFVIGLTFLTVMAFGVFIAMFIKKMFINKSESPHWGPQLLTIAEELKDRGLKQQAIKQYENYLTSQEVDLATRSRVYSEISELYLELGHCDQAILWYLHAKAAQPKAPRAEESERQFQECRKRSGTSNKSQP